jgi:hypothetical protein
MQKVFEYDEGCQNCRNNPKAKKPYASMKRFRMTNLTETAAYKLAQENKVELGCVLCHVVRAFVKLPAEEGLRLLEVEKHGNNQNQP